MPGLSKTVALVSLIIALGTLALAGVRSIVGRGRCFAVGPDFSFPLRGENAQKGVVRGKWEPRQQKPRRRTFLEWLYERNQIRAPKMFDDDKKDS